jgi:uncharacterized protein (TIGR02444 family)
MTDNDTLWDFSLTHYQAVEPLCLRLQDEAGFEINSLLWVMWCVQNGRDPGPRTTDAAQLAQAWSVSTGALRTARREMKTPPDGLDPDATAALRTQVKACELEAERLLQLALATLARGLPRIVPSATAAFARAETLALALGADARHPDLAILAKQILG